VYLYGLFDVERRELMAYFLLYLGQIFFNKFMYKTKFNYRYK